MIACYTFILGTRSIIESVKHLPTTAVFSRNISEQAMKEEEAKQITWVDWLLEPISKSIFPTERVQSYVIK